MNQPISNEKNEMLKQIARINQVEGFDPSPFAVDFTDMETGETRKRLPVMTQLAWFRMRYPEGKIAVSVTAGKDCFVASAKVYPNYRDASDAYLAEATASRGFLEGKPSISPREWAQTAAVGIALRNAGFGLQFAIAGDSFEEFAPNEFGEPDPKPAATPEPSYETMPSPPHVPTESELLEAAMDMDCPITKFAGKKLRDLISLDPGALKWLATKYEGRPEVKNAAIRICEYAVKQSA